MFLRAKRASRLPAGLPTPTSSWTASSFTASASSGTLYFWTSFVHVDRSTTQFPAIQFGDGLLALVRIGHLDKRKPARTPSIAICHESDAVNLSILSKELTKLVLASSEIEIPNKDVFHEMFSNEVDDLNVGDKRRRSTPRRGVTERVHKRTSIAWQPQ
jgi:hypothetical protein